MTKHESNVKQNDTNNKLYKYLVAVRKNYVHNWFCFIVPTYSKAINVICIFSPCVLVMASASNSTVVVKCVYERICFCTYDYSLNMT